MNFRQLNELEARHDAFWRNPGRGDRLVTFSWSRVPGFDYREVFARHEEALRFVLARLQHTLDVADDSIPMLRVPLGTGLVASAFGAEIVDEANGNPTVRSHPITSEEALAVAQNPSPINAGLFPLAYERMSYFAQHMPEGVKLCQCDLQGPWNTAHLLAGDQIWTDLYDRPEFVRRLLRQVTDFMIAAVPPMKHAAGEPAEFFYLQHSRISGASRICNCSTDMISPTIYEQFLLEEDSRFFAAVGGGMIHICGSRPHCLPLFNKIASLRALEVNFNYLDIFEVSKALREDIVLICTGPVEPPLLTELGADTLNRFCRKEFPTGRNMLFHFNDPASREKCKLLYDSIHS